MNTLTLQVQCPFCFRTFTKSINLYGREFSPCQIKKYETIAFTCNCDNGQEQGWIYAAHITIHIDDSIASVQLINKEN